MDLVALRERWTEELRAVDGSEWVEDHAALLDDQWEFLVECHFL